METYETIKKFLAEGGKCLLIENGKPVGVVLTMEEYGKLQNKSETADQKPAVTEPAATHPIGEAMIKEIFPGLPAEALAKAGASADFADINLADAGEVAIEDLGLDELPFVD